MRQIRPTSSTTSYRAVRRSSRTLAILALVALVGAPVTAGAGTFRRGDANGDGNVGLTDVLATVGFLFLRSGELACPDAADANDTGTVDVADCLYTLSHLYLGGSAPPAPGPVVCGLDPTPDDLGECSSSYCESGKGPGPGPLHLPPDNAAEAAAKFAQGLVSQAVGAVLNSEGDSIDLHLKGSLSVAPIVPGVAVNVSVSLDPTIQRIADGGFELSVSLEGAGGIGVELHEGVEAGVLAVTKSKVLCRFESIEETLAAIEKMVAAQALLPLTSAADSVLGAFESLARRLEQAVQDLGASRLAEKAIRDAIAAAQAGIRAIEKKISDLSKPIRDARDKVAELEDAVDAACGRVKLPGCGALKSSLQAAQDALAALNRQKSALVSRLANARQNLSGLQVQLQPAVDAVRAAEQLVGQLDDQIASMRDQVGRAQDVLDVIASSDARIRSTAFAYELRKSSSSTVEAFLSPFPGVEVEGMGAGIEYSTDAGVTARVELSLEGAPVKVGLMLSKEYEVAATAAMVVGAKGSASLQLAAIGEFELGGGERFFQASGQVKLTLDAQAVAVLGAGWTLQYGAGTQMELSIDAADLIAFPKANWQLVKTGDPADLIRALVDFNATYTRQDRRIAAVVFGLAVGKLGNGAGVEASATWNDQGPGTSQDLPIGQGVVDIFTSDAVTGLIEMLEAAVVDPRA